MLATHINEYTSIAGLVPQTLNRRCDRAALSRVAHVSEKPTILAGASLAQLVQLNFADPSTETLGPQRCFLCTA